MCNSSLKKTNKPVFVLLVCPLCFWKIPLLHREVQYSHALYFIRVDPRMVKTEEIFFNILVKQPVSLLVLFLS